jgi:hypothetical protein
LYIFVFSFSQLILKMKNFTIGWYGTAFSMFELQK